MRISFSDRKTGWFLVLAGLILLGLFSFDFYDNSKYLSRAVRGYGKIVSFEPINVDGRYIPRLVEVQFSTESSQVYKVLLPDYVFQPHYYHGLYFGVGQPVTFLYDLDHPAQVRSLQVANQYPWSEILLILAGFIPIYFGGRILKNSKAGI